jgi:hypothetical protein
MAVNMYWDPTSKVRYIYSYIYIDKMCIYLNVSIIVHMDMHIYICEDILEIPMILKMYWDPTSKVYYIYSYIYIDEMCIYLSKCV